MPGFWSWLFGTRASSYEVLTAQSFVSAQEAGREAQNQLNASGGKAVGIAASALCCEGKVEWNVYVLISR